MGEEEGSGAVGIGGGNEGEDFYLLSVDLFSAKYNLLARLYLLPFFETLFVLFGFMGWLRKQRI